MTETTPTQADTYCERAITMMRSLHVLPTPKHYSIFFSCAAGQPSELVREIEQLVEKREYFGDELLERLYTNYLAAAQTRAVQETAATAKRILTEMVTSISQYSGGAQTISDDVARQIDALDDSKLTVDSLKLVANIVIQSAAAIKESSQSVTEKLATAQREITDLRENLAKATTESERDFLTGTYNRKAFDTRLLEAIEDSRATDNALTVLMLDIDHFKKFNDSFGHLIGDEVLKIVARTLVDSVKGMDIVARFGGEEFAVILPNTPLGGGMIVAEAIRKSIASKELKRRSTGENYGQITVSIGVAALRDADGPESLVKRADEALYRSKKSGRNRVTQENLSE